MHFILFYDVVDDYVENERSFAMRTWDRQDRRTRVETF